MSLTLTSGLAFGLPSGIQAVNRGNSSAMTGRLEAAESSEEEERMGESPVVRPLTSEACLLQLLPVNNKLFLDLKRSLESMYIDLKTTANGPAGGGLGSITEKAQATLEIIDSKRRQLEPAFNPDDSTDMTLLKGTRGEQLIEELRSGIENLIAASKAGVETDSFVYLKIAFLALSDIGELLVENFPYDVPYQGKFSYLPRLQGRAKVTFTFRRGASSGKQLETRAGKQIPEGGIIGNVTIIADGFAAPVTAGNFVDLCMRQFYTGLPMKNIRKKLAAPNIFQSPLLTNPPTIPSSIESALREVEEELVGPSMSLPILGSFKEGFYDPLTAKPRRIPLEIAREGPFSRSLILTYAKGFAELPANKTFELSTSKIDLRKPVITFRTPGIVGFNHPERNVNMGSSEFFVVPERRLSDDVVNILDGQYAPLGYIVDGYDLYQSLKPGDVIDATDVNEWGQLNLVRIRGTSFTDVIQGNSEEEEKRQ